MKAGTFEIDPKQLPDALHRIIGTQLHGGLCYDLASILEEERKGNNDQTDLVFSLKYQKNGKVKLRVRIY